jgi:hypothetical protein
MAPSVLLNLTSEGLNKIVIILSLAVLTFFVLSLTSSILGNRRQRS